MSRLITAGAEANHNQVDNVTVVGTIPIVSAPVHSGNFAYSIPYAATGPNVLFSWTGVSGRWFYSRIWLRATGLPSAARQIANIFQTTIGLRTIYQHPDGTISSHATYGVNPHSAPIPINEYHCLEIGMMSDGVNLYWKLRLDGVQFTSLSAAVSQIANRLRIGIVSGPTDASTIYFDDMAFNDDQGSNQNSWPDVLGKIVLLTPSSDQAIGANWGLGLGTAPGGLAYDSVNNVPPLGIANGTAGSDPKQIRNAVASVAQPAADVDLKCPAYSSVVPIDNTIKVLAPVFELGHTSNTVACNFDVGLIDKPSQTLFSAALVAGAAGTFPASWTRIGSDILYDPSVLLSDQAVLRIGRRTAVALTELCCFAGLMLEYEPVPPSGQKFLAVA